MTGAVIGAAGSVVADPADGDHMDGGVQGSVPSRVEAEGTTLPTWAASAFCSALSAGCSNHRRNASPGLGFIAPSAAVTLLDRIRWGQSFRPLQDVW